MYHQMKSPQQASVAARLHNLICNALSYKIHLDLILISSQSHLIRSSWSAPWIVPSFIKRLSLTLVAHLILLQISDLHQSSFIPPFSKDLNRIRSETLLHFQQPPLWSQCTSLCFPCWLQLKLQSWAPPISRLFLPAYPHQACSPSPQLLWPQLGKLELEELMPKAQCSWYSSH